MNFKYTAKLKRTSVTVVLLSILSAIILQLALGFVTAYLVESGHLPESSMSICAMIIRSISVVAATVLFWFMTPDRDNRIRHSLFVIGSIVVLPLVVSLLFWDVSVSELLIGSGVSVAIYSICVWVLLRSKSRGAWPRGKKRFC